MRNRTWMAGLLLGFVLAAPVWAQNRPASSLLTGVNPQDIVFKPIDTSNMVTPIPLTTDKFSFGRLFSKAFIPDFLKSSSTTPPPLKPTVPSIKTSSPLHHLDRCPLRSPAPARSASPQKWLQHVRANPYERIPPRCTLESRDRLRLGNPLAYTRSPAHP